MATKAGAAYIEIRGEHKKLQGDLDASHRKIETAAKRMKTTLTTAAKRAGIAVAAAFAIATYKAVSLVKESALLAARFETLDIVMKQVGKNAGYSAEQMDSYDISLRKTGISMIESRNSLARMAQAQLDLSKATQLGRIAQDAAVIGNINSSEAFQRMIYGIQSGNLLVLKTIGINVSFENSYKKVAKATGRAKTSFTQAEKAIIRQNAVIEYGSRIAGTYEAAMTTAGKKLSSFTRYVEDFKVKMGKAFGPATVSLVDAATKAMKEMQTEITRPEVQESLKAISGELSDILVSLGRELPSKIEAITKKAEMLWKITSYDPSIIEFGVIGLVLFGRQGARYAAYLAAIAHFATWASVLGKALGLVASGFLDISQVANANFKELEELVKRFDFPDPLKNLQLQAKQLEERILSLKKVTEGQIFTFRGDKELLEILQEELIDVEIAIKLIQETASKGLGLEEQINQAEQLKKALKDPDLYYGASAKEEPVVSTLSEEQIKVMQAQEAFAIRMANIEMQRMRDGEKLRLDMLESFRTAKMSETELALDVLDKQFLAYDDFIQNKTALDAWYVEKYNGIMADANAEKLAVQADFEDQIFEIGKTSEELQIASVQKQAEVWRQLGYDKVDISRWTADQIERINEESADDIIGLSQRTADAMEDNFSSFYRDFFRGELDSAEDYFRKFCHSLTDSFSDMLGQMTKEMLFGGSSGSSGLLGDLLSTGVSSLFGGGGTSIMQGTGSGTAAQQGVANVITLWHKGGTVGVDAAPTRMMPASLFAHAPRLHEGYSGLKSDEFPAILKYNETVLPPGVKPINKTQNTQNTTISVPVTVDADRRLGARLQVEIENTVKNVMREEMR